MSTAYIFILKSKTLEQMNVDNRLARSWLLGGEKNMPKYLMLFLLLSNLRKCHATVLRGSRAQDGQFPWLIQFHTISPCGGVLISPDWVLTAAQCVLYKRNSIVLYATGLNGTGTRQAVSVKATYIYPKFQGYSKSRDYDNNIALLKLVKSFDMCDSKVRLLDVAPVRSYDDYKSCLIFGWESTVAPSSKVHAKPIQYSQVLLNSWRVCMYMHEGNSSYRNVFCTMIDDEDGIRACAGNPGSPVVCEDQYQRMVLLGIASWSSFSLDCGGLPTYLGVSVFRSWMWDLIFGNRNMEQWDSGIASGAGACQRERHLGGIRAESNLRSLRTQNFTDRAVIHPERSSGGSSQEESDTENEDAYDMSWKSASVSRNNPPKSSTRRTFEVSKIPELRGKLEPRILDHITDYTRILSPGDSRKASNWNVVREREEQLSQYREIGGEQYHHDDEPIAIPSQHEKIAYIAGKAMKINFEQNNVEGDTENFDVLELVMPDGIEDFNRSGSNGVLCAKYFRIVFVISLCAFVNMLI